MNTTTPTDHALVDPEMEVWGARLTSYLSAMGMVILQYDCLLTLKHEMRLVWPGTLSIPKFLYYLNRYLSFVTMIFSNYQLAGLRPPVSTMLCKAWILVTGTALPIATLSSTALLTLRVTALYQNVRWFTPLLWVTFVLFQGLRTSMMVLATVTLFGSLRYSPISNVCIPINTSYRSTVPMMVPGIYDFILLSLTLIKGLKSIISLRANTSSAIMFTLIRDEILFFSIISTLRIFNSIVWLVLSPGLIGVGILAEWGLESTLTSRFFLNLRSIASQQPQTTFEPHAIPSAISAVRKRRTWNQSGPPTTNSSGLEMDKTIYYSETNPPEGDIQEAEAFDLRELHTQHHRNERDLGTKNDIDQS